MSIEPTEEQKQAAAAFVARHGEQNEVIDSGGQARLEWSPTHTVNDIARLLAEREAKLTLSFAAHLAGCDKGWGDEVAALRARLEAVLSVLDPEGDCDTDLDGEHLSGFVRKVLDAHVAAGEQGARGEVEALKDEADTLRARVAELERMLSTLSHGYHQAEDDFLADIKELEEREAQHLADIRAAKDALEQARPSVEAWVTSDAEDVDSDADALQAHGGTRPPRQPRREGCGRR